MGGYGLKTETFQGNDGSGSKLALDTSGGYGFGLSPGLYDYGAYTTASRMGASGMGMYPSPHTGGGPSPGPPKSSAMSYGVNGLGGPELLHPAMSYQGKNSYLLQFTLQM